MRINITEMVSEANFRIDNLYKLDRKNCPITNKSKQNVIKTKRETICYIPRDPNSGPLVESYKIKKMEGMHIVFRACSNGTNCHGIDSVEYLGRTPLQYYSIPNPNPAGASGLKYWLATEDSDRGKHALFSSGMLTGCAYAVLYFDNHLIFVHSGATDSILEASDVDKQQKILRDLYFAVCNLVGTDPGNIDLLPKATLVDFLLDLKISGIVAVHCANSEELGVVNIRQEDKICLINYNSSTSIYCVANQQRDVSVLVKSRDAMINNSIVKLVVAKV